MLNLYKIFRGTVANDKTGTPARTAAQGINDNMDLIKNEFVRIDDATEKIINKATNLDAPNNTNYPTTQAVVNAVEGIENNANLYTDDQLVNYQAKSEKGLAGGYAGLDENAKVPAANTYGVMDEIIEGEYINATTFNDTTGDPVTPGAAKLYQDTSIGNPNSGMQYRWSGSQFSPIPSSPGTTDEIVEGTQNLYYTGERVRSTILTGLNTIVSGVISGADTVLSAFGKLQAQITGLKNSLANKLDKGTYTGTAKDLETLANSKETTSGAQAKADAALEAAKDYYDGLDSDVTSEEIEAALGFTPANADHLLTPVPENAVFTDTVYTHPESHPASIIVETSGKRFVSDAEKAAWNAKQNAIPFTPANESEVVKGIKTADGEELSKDAQGKSTLPDFALKSEVEGIDFTTDESLYLDENNVLRANISTYSQTLTKSGSQVFTLDFEPTNFVTVHGRVSLFESDYIFTSPTTLEIIPELAEGEKVRVVYERFIEQPA